MIVLTVKQISNEVSDHTCSRVAAEQEEPLEIRVGADEVKEEDLEGDDDEPINADLEWETTASKLREAEKSAAAADAAERKAKLAAEPYDNPLLEHVRSNVTAEPGLATYSIFFCFFFVKNH